MENSILLRSNTANTVLRQFRKDIVFGVYEDEVPVRELELAQAYHCSRAAVRSVLIVLEKEGLISTKSNGTKTVHRLSVQDVENLYDLRQYIELTAVHQFFLHSPRDMSFILKSFNDIINSKGKTVEDVLKIDGAFHKSIILSGGNRAISQAWINISDVMQAVFNLNMTVSEQYKDYFCHSFQEKHTLLFTSLMSDENNCKKLFLEHLTDAKQVSLKAVEKGCQERV